MNYIWSGMVIISLICAAFSGRLDETAAAALEGADASVKFLISLAGALCFWNGLLKIAEASGVSGAVRRLLMPVVKMLFKGAPEKAREYIAMNMSANLLGMGNAATPMGIKAMSELDKVNNKPLYASKHMCMLVALNTASIQLVPSTILAIRQAAGAANPESVVIPILAASFGGCLAAVTAVKIFISS